ncbi:MAG: DUF3987 domain-containing protein [Planctomycetales bacterium]|nr:DUF3987 domain-containing protein [Planctomycetales bacterium]
MTIDRHEINEQISAFGLGEDAFEIAVFGDKVRQYCRGIDATQADVIDQLENMDHKEPKAVYLRANPLDSERKNVALRPSFKQVANREGVNDRDILRRTNLTLDFDRPLKNPNYAATTNERFELERAVWYVVDMLQERGWPKPCCMVESGNGFQVTYAIDLRNNADSTKLVKRTLQGLKEIVEREGFKAKVDLALSNASTLVRLAGTTNRKFSDDPRPAKLLETNERVIVSREQLESVAAPPPAPKPKREKNYAPATGQIIDIQRTLEENEFPFNVTERDGERRYQMTDRCPLASLYDSGDHDLNESDCQFIEFESGGIGFCCKHGRCTSLAMDHDPTGDVGKAQWELLRKKMDLCFTEEGLKALEAAREAEVIKAWEPYMDHESREDGSRRRISEGSDVPDDWPRPKPLPSEIQAARLDLGRLPPIIRDYVEDIADRIQCPVDYPTVAVLVCASSLIGRQIFIRPKANDNWTVCPNLWGMIVGRPSSMKSPALAEPLSLLQGFESEERLLFDERMKAFESKSLIHDEMSRIRKRELAKAVAGEDSDRAANIADEITNGPMRPTCRRFKVNSSTYEKLHELCGENPIGLLSFRDELSGLLSRLSREELGEERAFYLEAWTGLNGFTTDRIGRGTVHAEAVCLSILGGIQPSRLRQHLTANGDADDGLVQRFQLTVWPEVAGDFRNVDRLPDRKATQNLRNCFERLKNLNVGDATEIEDDGRSFCRFTPEAQAIFNDWRVNLENEIRSGDLPPAFESHLGKYRSLVPSLALIFEIIEHGVRSVTSESLELAIGYSGYLRSHAMKTYGDEVSPDIQNAKQILRWVKDGTLGREFTLRDIYRPQRAGIRDKETAHRGVDVLVDFGWIRRCDRRLGSGQTRSTVPFEVHPIF